jgi:hypothetical protein
MKIQIKDVVEGSVVKFSTNGDLGDPYLVTKITSDGEDLRYSFLDLTTDRKFPSMYYQPDTPVTLIDSPEDVDSNSAKQELLNLIGEECTNTATTSSKIPAVTYLLFTGEIT